MKLKNLTYLTMIIVLLGLVISAAENEKLYNAPKIFFDCERADFDYVREQVPFVNYINERKQADIYILGTYQRTAGGGLKYTLNFIGQNQYAGKDDTLSFTIREDQTWDDTRQKMVKTLKLGLMQYITQTPIARDIEIIYRESEEAIVKQDKWNNWVYKINTSGNISGEESSRDLEVGLRLSADRITEEWKIMSSIDFDYDENYEELEDEKITATRKDFDIDLLTVKSLTRHLSIGSAGEFESNTYSNIKYSFHASPAIEWNIFPYSEANRREFSIRYNIGVGYSNYRDTTIYNKTKEFILNHSLNFNVEFKQTWGEIDINVSGRNYFPDTDKNRLNIYNNISLHLFQGFSLSIRGGAALIHDQISLAKGDVSDIDRLLHIRELETDYSYWFGIGLEYTFGSIYNNIVNPRF